MIANITQTFTTYDPNEFLPVYYEGKLTNKDQFITYKVKSALRPIVHKIDKVFTDH